MKGVKEIKARIKSVGNIKKVTSTMELVATAKLKKLQERALASRPYADAIRAMMTQIAEHVGDDVSPLLAQPEEVENECVLVIAADKGLCGAFNVNQFRVTQKYIDEREAQGVKCSVYAIGRRTETYFRKTPNEIIGAVEEKVEAIDYRRAAVTLQALVKDFLNGKFQRVSLAYTQFKSPVSFVPTVEEVLPLAPVAEVDEEKVEEVKAELDYIMEPSAEYIMERLIPKTLEMKVYNAVLESLASEFASRRVAMKNATDSAKEMIDELTMEYNKARQAGITGELLEITAGAEALKG